jgi:hypothetical protein
MSVYPRPCRLKAQRLTGEGLDVQKGTDTHLERLEQAGRGLVNVSGRATGRSSRSDYRRHSREDTGLQVFGRPVARGLD